MTATKEELMAIDEIGEKIAESIMHFFSSGKNRELVARLKAAGLKMEMDAQETAVLSNILEGQSIVISGVFAVHSRDEYKDIIEKHGGKNVGSISKKTSFILAGENMGPSKLEKAQKLGIKIMNENEFLSLIATSEDKAVEETNTTEETQAGNSVTEVVGKKPKNDNKNIQLELF